MVTTVLSLEFGAADQVHKPCIMTKEIEMPYALREGDNICEGEPSSDEALDLCVESVWYELQNSQLMVLCKGSYDLTYSQLMALRDFLFAQGWMQALPIPR